MFKRIKQSLFFNIFIRITLIFAVFLLVIFLANANFLVDFFTLKEKSALSEQLKTISETYIEDNINVNDLFSEISEKYNFDAEIYNESGSVLYTTKSGQIIDFYRINNDRFTMSHEEMIVEKTENADDGMVFQILKRRFDNSEYLACTKEIADGIFAEVMIQMRLISNSAAIANQFIMIISSVCFIISVIWVFIFAKKFSKPITEMNEIAKDMTNLNFERKIKSAGENEIGQLALSINELSDSLNSALETLKEKNKKLEDDIEAERRLDTMRKAFIANVSHELKTPIAIINSYAEGLKLDINPESREEYCNTIISEGERMNKLVLSILELSKYESGQIMPDLKPLDISETVRDISEKIFFGKELSLKNNIPQKTFVLADFAQIEIVLTALLENAAAYTPTGGEVRIECGTGKNTRISVYNTGSHISDDEMPQIWQSFYRGDSSHKRDSSHFGLGLSVVSAIIKLHGTSCGVYNTDDGVCFWFELKTPEFDT